MIKREVFEIGGATFSVAPIPPIQAAGILAKLQRLILPPLAGLTKSGNTSNLESLMNADLSGDNLYNALMSLSNAITEEELQGLIRAILREDCIAVEYWFEDKKYSGQLDQNKINNIFAGKIFDMFKLMAKVIEVTYGDFFTIAKIHFGRLLANQKEQPKS